MKKTGIAVMVMAAAAALTACEKPDPRVTVFSGTSSEWVAPVCYSAAGELDGQQCLQQAVSKAAAGQTDRLAVAGGDVVGISVDPVIAESGWTVMIDQQPIVGEPLTTTYYRFTMPQQFGGQNLAMTVMSTGEKKGVWALRLEVNAE